MEKKTFFEKLKDKKRRQFEQKEQVSKGSKQRPEDIEEPSDDSLESATEEFDRLMQKLGDA